MESPATGDWIDMRAAAELAGIPVHRMRKLVRRGAVKIRKMPGLRADVSAASVRELAIKSVRPADKGVIAAEAVAP
jgi:hypothetical protein